MDHEGHLDCIDIDYCTRNPCGSHAECFDCSTQDCSDAVTEKSFLQRRGIIGGTEFEATDDYACWCNEHFLTTVGPNGELTCCKDHSCGVGGSCVDLSIVSDVSSQSDLRFTCACSWGYELNQNGALMVVTPVRLSVVVASLSRIPMRFPVPSSSQATMTNGLGGVRTQVVSDHPPTPYYVKLFGKCQRNVGQTSSHGLGGVRLLTPPKPCYDA